MPARTWAGVDPAIAGVSDPRWPEQLAAVYRWWPIGREVDPVGAAIVVHTCGLVHPRFLGLIVAVNDEVWYGRGQGQRRVSLRVAAPTKAAVAAYGGLSCWVPSPRGPLVQYFA